MILARRIKMLFSLWYMMTGVEQGGEYGGYEEVGNSRSMPNREESDAVSRCLCVAGCSSSEGLMPRRVNNREGVVSMRHPAA